MRSLERKKKIERDFTAYDWWGGKTERVSEG